MNGKEGTLYCKGTSLVRRNTSLIVKNFLTDINELIMHYETEEFIHNFIINYTLYLMRGTIVDTVENNQIVNPLYIMSTKLAENYKKTKPCHAILADRMNKRGEPIQVHERIQFMYTFPEIFTYDKADTKKDQYIENPEYIKQFGLKIAYLAYLKDSVNDISELLSVRFNDKYKFIKKFKISQGNKCIFSPCAKKGLVLCEEHRNSSIEANFKTHKRSYYSGKSGIYLHYGFLPFMECIYNYHYIHRAILKELLDSFSPVFIEKI